MIDEPTHMQGGIIDHLYVRCPLNYYGIEIHSDITTPFYSDHFGIRITIHKKEKEFKHIPSTVPDYLIEEDKNGKKKGSLNRNKSIQKSKASKRDKSKSPEKPKRHRG